MVAAGLLAALGGARPTGLAGLDPLLLGLAGAAVARAAVEARSIPLYLACAAPALVQLEPVPRVLGAAAMVCVLVRRSPRAGAPAAAAAGGLAWAATIGAPFEPGAEPLVVPLLGMVLLLVSARRAGSKAFKRRFDRVGLVVGGLAIVGGGLAATAAVSARNHLERSAELLEAGLAAARDGDTVGAVESLQGAQNALERGDKSVGALWARPALLVPGVSQNLQALERIVDEVRSLTAAGVQAAREADVDTLRARGGRIDLAAVATMEPPLARVLDALEHADEEVADVADQWLLPYVRDRVEEAQDEIADALPSARLALSAVRTAPSLLGGDGPRTYLVLFTTPVEARATTGFFGNYAELTFDDGSFSLTRFGRSPEINEALPEGGATLTGVDEYLQRYGRFGPMREWQNVPVSPDFPTVAFVAAQLYAQGGGRPVDGVMSIDPTALGALLRLTGPVRVAGVPDAIDADSAAQYLHLDQYIQLPDVAARIDVLERLSQVVMAELTTVDLPGPRELGDLFGPIVEDKHLQLTSFDEGGEDLFDRMGISGRYGAVDGDSVGVTTSNTGGNKIDVFLRRSLDYDVTWDPDTRELTATATITLVNEAPSSGLPDYLIGNARGDRPLEAELPRGTNGSFVTLYTPWDPTGATLDGQAIDVENGRELGRHALSTFVEIPPGGTSTLVIQLRGILDREAYALDLLAQPLVEPETASVSVRLAGGGRLRATGPLEGSRNEAAGTFPLVRDVRVGVSPGR